MSNSLATPQTVACQAPLPMGILQARILEWIAMPSSRGSFQSRDQTQVSCVSCIGRWILYHSCQLGNLFICSAVLSCSVMSDSCDPMDCSPPGPSVLGDSPGKNTGVCCHAVLQGIFPTQGMNPGLLNCRWILYHLSHQGSPDLIM